MDEESALSHVFQMITRSPACVMNTRWKKQKKSLASHQCVLFLGIFYDVAKMAIFHLKDLTEIWLFLRYQ